MPQTAAAAAFVSKETKLHAARFNPASERRFAPAKIVQRAVEIANDRRSDLLVGVLLQTILPQTAVSAENDHSSHAMKAVRDLSNVFADPGSGLGDLTVHLAESAESNSENGKRPIANAASQAFLSHAVVRKTPNSGQNSDLLAKAAVTVEPAFVDVQAQSRARSLVHEDEAAVLHQLADALAEDSARPTEEIGAEEIVGDAPDIDS